MFYTILIFLEMAVLYSSVYSLQMRNVNGGKIKYLDELNKNVKSRPIYHLGSEGYDLQFIQKLMQSDNNKIKSIDYKQHSLNRDKKYNSQPFLIKKYLFGDYPWMKLTKHKEPKHRLSEGFQGLHGSIPSDLNDYSKLYVVLNSKANLSISDVKDMSNMISFLLSKSHFKKPTIKDQISETYYKGFVIKDNRRRLKEPKEKFSLKDSIEHDYKPKRGRGDYGGGGGGRTLIPYIRQRGDIYETE